jgi:hypothetical protein
VASAITILLTVAYALLTDVGAPVWRATLMLALYLSARLLYRRKSMLNTIGAAALALLIVDPAALLGASFQLSFRCVLVIALDQDGVGPSGETLRRHSTKRVRPCGCWRYAVLDVLGTGPTRYSGFTHAHAPTTWEGRLRCWRLSPSRAMAGSEFSESVVANSSARGESAEDSRRFFTRQETILK